MVASGTFKYVVPK